MSLRFFRFAAPVVCLLALCHSAVSAQDQASLRRLLLDRDRDIKAVLAHSPLSDAEMDSLRGIVNGLILFEVMGKNALGDYWAGLTDAQRQDFIQTFASIVREQSLADLDPYRAKVTIDSIGVNGTTAHAATTAVYKDVTTKVEYDFLLRKGKWWITDISLDGVSTTDGYAHSFQSAIRKRGFDGLMKSLHKRLEKIKN
jgi:phospholipid transport system substrate-binding protein